MGANIDIIRDSNIINSTRKNIESVVDNYIEDIAHNGGDVLKDWTICSKYGFLIDKIKDSLKPYVVDEISKYEKSTAEKYSCEFKVIETGVRYDYSDNPAWRKQKAIVDEETNKLKNIESFIKTLSSPASIVDEETGEVIPYYPATKTGSETVRTSIK